MAGAVEAVDSDDVEELFDVVAVGMEETNAKPDRIMDSRGVDG